MLVTRTEWDVVGFRKNGVMESRLQLQVVDNVSGVVVAFKYHRPSLDPGDNFDAMIAANNVSLASLGYPPIGPADVARLQALVNIEHTPAAVATFRAARGQPVGG